ncbi:hypothetical protein FQR65_LT00315 [Abscondita terminalis]|nr:hypothetical protein FQR65_LT00315 [Abscondita terminalis]
MDRCKEQEPRVINVAMIKQCLNNNAPRGEAGRIQREEGIPFDEIEEMRIEFQKILRIDHLWILPALTKLSLSNNFIERIENLEVLVNLVELDLSFNKIEKIENLDNLVYIENLSLFDNNISKIENLDALKKLIILTIGNNKINDRSNIAYLRRFRFLRSVNLKGNPCAEGDDFVLFASTVLPQITYYQYKLVDPIHREIGEEKYKDLLLEISINEAEDIKIRDKIEAELIEAELHAGSFVEFLGSDYLFEQMYENDEDGKAFLTMDASCHVRYIEYKEEFVKCTIKIFDMGQIQYQIRKAEVEQFFDCINTAKRKSENESIEKMETFLEEKQKIFTRMKESDENFDNHSGIEEESFDMLQSISDDYNRLLHQVWKDLMGLELNLYESMEDVISSFEQTVTEMVNTFIETAQGYFTEIRNLETNYHDLLCESANSFFTTVNTDDGIAMCEELKVIMKDKESLFNALGATHDLHMLTIDTREDTLVNKAQAWLHGLVSSLTKDEVKRNRGKVLEINHFLDIQREEFEELHSFVTKGTIDLELKAVLQ